MTLTVTKYVDYFPTDGKMNRDANGLLALKHKAFNPRLGNRNTL